LICHIDEGTYAELFENRVLRSIFRSAREEVTRELRRLNYAELKGL
jgi:hypothetical protein